MKVPITGGIPSLVANTTEGLYGLTTDGVSFVYWVSGSGSKTLYRTPLGSVGQSGARLLSRANHTASQGLCVEGNTVYWGLSGQSATGGGNRGEILRVTLSESSASVDRVLATYAYVYSLACNSTHVFWSARTTDSTYGIWRMAKGSNTVEMVPGAEGTKNTGQLVVNETAVFVLGTGDSISAFPLQ